MKAYFYKELNGKPSKVKYKNMTLHRIDGPAVIEIYDDNRIFETWYQNGKVERKDGPAFTRSNSEGFIDFEQYIKDGAIVRDFLYDSKGRLLNERHMSYSESDKGKRSIDDCLHRENGPANVRYDYETNTKELTHCLEGTLISKVVEPLTGFDYNRPIYRKRPYFYSCDAKKCSLCSGFRRDTDEAKSNGRTACKLCDRCHSELGY